MFRILLYGIIRSISHVGPLDGLMGGRFILVFLSVICIIGAKGLYIATMVAGYWFLGLSTVAIMIGLQFVPQLMLALFTTIGCSRSSVALIIYHPETLLLPSGT